ncbi:LPS export ABC transporter ATP-binding protein [Orrella dioscoreae]|uniref:Lipopolysaccharide export system ATP-binding protein LptB n=2 Tax=root TaxID=1 RepID=A0A1C3K4U7_9BURK|nr:LPS export ABC transporter ATP-binding protein [Orrella dioscoreae]SBT26530.1 Lipopolysaccharide ABC transporter, ATP-binding protein LptB [Orrella dioscoreae]SOE46859.1 Lipopolysaccharide ABC transporter, ATP-binding protein LptB [Orrella dioscoreae]
MSADAKATANANATDADLPGASAAVASGLSSQAGRLRAVGLRKTYNSRTVVQDVSIAVDSGEVVGLLGPNGAGKTTSFYMIVGLVPADAGRIEIDGVPVTAMPIHKRARLGLSYLPQDASVFRRLTVEQNIRAVLELQVDANGKALSAAKTEELLESLLEELQIGHIRRNMAISLSGGERRRVEIARALATQPRFILLDEPFAGVDPIAVIEIQRIVRFLKSRNIGVLITDHNVRETLGICDRAYIISEGKVLTDGHPDEIVGDPAVRRVYLGEHFRM